MTRALLLGFLVLTPLALAVVLWFHPAGATGTDNIYAGVREDVDDWLFVHTGFLLATPLLALAAYLLLRGLTGTAATVSRVALVFFLCFYTAYEVTIGLGTGVLVEYANGLPPSEQAAVAGAIDHYNHNDVLGDPVSVSLVLGFFGLGGRDAGGRRRVQARGSRLAGDDPRRALRVRRDPSAAGRPGRSRLLRRSPPCSSSAGVHAKWARRQ